MYTNPALCSQRLTPPLPHPVPTLPRTLRPLPCIPCNCTHTLWPGVNTTRSKPLANTPRLTCPQPWLQALQGTTLLHVPAPALHACAQLRSLPSPSHTPSACPGALRLRAISVFEGLSQLVFYQSNPSYGHHLPAHLSRRLKPPAPPHPTCASISLPPVSFRRGLGKCTHLILCLFALVRV